MFHEIQLYSCIVLCAHIYDFSSFHVQQSLVSGRAHLKCDGTCTETRFGLSGKRTNPFKSAGESVHSTTGSRGVRISGSNGSNAGYTMFLGRVKDYWLATPLVCFPFASPTVHDRVPSGFNWVIKQSDYRAGQALRVPGGWASQISRQSVSQHKKLVRSSILRTDRL